MLFSSSFRCCYLTIDLVRSPIVGCEGTGAGRFVQSQKATYGTFQQCLLGTRSFTEGNIEGHRGTTIFYQGSLLKRPCSRDVTIFRQATNGITLRVHVCKVCLICMHLVFDQGGLFCCFYLAIHTYLLAIYEKQVKGGK